MNINELPEIATITKQGIFAGIAPAEEGLPQAFLFVDEKKSEKMDWDSAVKYAAALGEGAHLPSVTEAPLVRLAILKLNPEQRGWMWTSTQYSAYTAFVQHFEYGIQDTILKDSYSLVRPVRRFNNLVI